MFSSRLSKVISGKITRDNSVNATPIKVKSNNSSPFAFFPDQSINFGVREMPITKHISIPNPIYKRPQSVSVQYIKNIGQSVMNITPLQKGKVK